MCECSFPLYFSDLYSLDSAPLLGRDHMFETMTLEIEQLLTKVRGCLGTFIESFVVSWMSLQWPKPGGLGLAAR